MNSFSDLELTPSAEFAARLEAELLRDLSETGTPPAPIIDLLSIEPPKRHSSLWPQPLLMLATAAAVIALVAIAISATWNEHSRPADSIPPSSSVAVTSEPAEFVPVPPANAEVAPGAYAVTHFTVPFTITTTGTWIHEKNWLTIFSFLRLVGPKFAVTAGLFDGATPAEAIAGFCPEALDTSEPIESVLLDQPALQVTGRATAACAFPIANDTEARVSIGDMVQVTATSVNGEIVVVVASALWPLWPALEAEIAALLSSMHPIA